jgi:hypothetical protein
MVSPFRERAEQAHAFPWKNDALSDPGASLAFANACEKERNPAVLRWNSCRLSSDGRQKGGWPLLFAPGFANEFRKPCEVGQSEVATLAA